MKETRRSSIFWMRAALGCMVVCAAVGIAAAADPPADPPMRLGFSSTFFHDINENDARAALKALAAAISHQRHLAADPEPHLYQGTRAMVDGIKDGTVNAVSITTEEYWLLRQSVGFRGLLLSTFDGAPEETYVLVAHREGPVHTLADLRGREVALQRGPRMSLATVWMDVELAHEGLPALNRCCARLTPATKPSKALLPVFFRQMDAAIVSARTFATLCELNPQLSHALQVVRQSPGYVPCGFALTGTLPDPLRERWLRECSALDETPVGAQVLTIFQSARVRQFPETALQTALQLMDEHAQLCPEANAVRLAGLQSGRGDLAAR